MRVFGFRLLCLLGLSTILVTAQGPGGGLEPASAPEPPASREVVMKACAEIATVTGDKVEYEGSRKYDKENKRYWSKASTDLKPACIVFPSRRDNVVKVVQVLLANPTIRYAIKSGGHMPNPTFNSVAGGILIAFSSMSVTYYDNLNKLALVEPGARWGAVIESLEPYGVTVVGGRLADVGTGLLLGGGLSFLSTQRGLASANVREYEMVLANGTVANVNSVSHPDLFFAMKTGGNQFGIVTRYTLEAFPQGKIWGGFRVYRGRAAPLVLAAVQNLTENYVDPKAAVIVTFDRLINRETIIIFFFYDGESPPPGVFGGLENIPSMVNNVKKRTYSQMLETANKGNIIGVRYIIRTLTIPNLQGANGVGLITNLHSTWQQNINLATKLDRSSVGSLAFQPLPRSIARETNKRGGTPMGFTEEMGDHLFIEMDISWTNGKSDPGIHSHISTITETFNAQYKAQFKGLKATNMVQRSAFEGNATMPVANTAGDEYLPIFPNDATWDQGVYRSYKDFEKLGNIQKAYDPNGFFSKRTDGWRFS